MYVISCGSVDRLGSAGSSRDMEKVDSLGLGSAWLSLELQIGKRKREKFPSKEQIS